MRFRVVIPARYDASRLPGKPLRNLAGRPLVQHVWDRAVESGATEVVVATDDDRVAGSVEAFGGRAAMTPSRLRSGTERLVTLATEADWDDDDIVVNLQGDEPLMPPAIIHQVAADLAAHPEGEMATLATRIRSAEELHDPHVVKVVHDARGWALYFSRAPIPWERDAFAEDAGRLPERGEFLRHVGIYAYRVGFLREYPLDGECRLEEAEALEQLRVLYHGHRIHVAEALEPPGHGVDTDADLARAEAALARRG